MGQKDVAKALLKLISPIFPNYHKIGFLLDFLVKFSWLFDELLENRLICDKRIPYLTKNESIS